MSLAAKNTVPGMAPAYSYCKRPGSIYSLEQTAGTSRYFRRRDSPVTGVDPKYLLWVTRAWREDGGCGIDTESSGPTPERRKSGGGSPKTKETDRSWPGAGKLLACPVGEMNSHRGMRRLNRRDGWRADYHALAD